jgi:hypothetical protein
VSLAKFMILKFIHSEKAKNSCEISTVDLSYICSASQIYIGDFAKYCGLLRIYKLYHACTQCRIAIIALAIHATIYVKHGGYT